MNFIINEILLGIIAVAMTIIAIKITFSFNINEYLKRKDERLHLKIKNNCTHVNIGWLENGDIAVQSCFYSPSGISSYTCQKCGMQVDYLNEDDEKRRVKYFLNNPKILFKKEKKFKKLIKKAGIV